MLALVQWWNLPFTIPFALAVVYLLLASFGVVGAGDDASAEAGAEAGAAADGPDGADGGDAAGAETAAEAEHGHDPLVYHAEAETAALGGAGPDGSGREPSPAARLLDFFGLGRIPLTVVLQLFFLVWGFSGWAATTILAPILGEPLLFFWPSLLVAGLAAVAVTRLFARPLARWLPGTESYSVSKTQLVGQLGTVVFPVGATSGTVHLRDRRGNLHQIVCRTADGSTVLNKGAEVIVVSYDAAADRYVVVPSDLPPLPWAVQRT